MRGKWLFWVRRLHLYLSVFFAPLLLLFVITGWAQTMDFDHSSSVMRSLSQVHTRQYYPVVKAGAAGEGKSFDGKPGPFRGVNLEGKGGKLRGMTWPTKGLVVAMCIALLVSISLGLVLAFTMVRNRIPVWIALILGVATPVGFLILAHLP
jgi:hypothetical protein